MKHRVANGSELNESNIVLLIKGIVEQDLGYHSSLLSEKVLMFSIKLILSSISLNLEWQLIRSVIQTNRVIFFPSARVFLHAINLFIV